MSKKHISGMVKDVSTNPFQTLSKKRKRNSTFFSFDISFDIVDEDGGQTHVWFNRSFRVPPQLNDGDNIEVIGRFGQLFGLFGRHNLYATRIIDRARGMEYTPGRNMELDEPAGRPGGAKVAEEKNLDATGGNTS